MYDTSVGCFGCGDEEQLLAVPLSRQDKFSGFRTAPRLQNHVLSICCLRNFKNSCRRSSNVRLSAGLLQNLRRQLIMAFVPRLSPR